MGLGSLHPLESSVSAAWAGENACGACSASRCSRHPPANLMRECPASGSHVSPQIQHVEKKDLRVKLSCQGWSLWEREPGGVF